MGDEMSDEGESGYCNPFLVSEKKLASSAPSLEVLVVLVVLNIPEGESCSLLELFFMWRLEGTEGMSIWRGFIRAMVMMMVLLEREGGGCVCVGLV